MARATGKDHARINLDIWGDDDWLDLTPAAQHLYFVLWTSPQLSYCGTGDWRPAKIAAKAKGWTPAQVEAAAAELSRRLFLIIDTDTEEFLLRSWAKHDGLWRTPNMAVSMANARADLASRTLRGVFVFEVLKLKKRNPESTSWTREAVVKMLSQAAVDPAELASFTPAVTLTVTPASTPPLTPDLTPPPTLNPTVGVNPTANPGPTPAPATPPAPFSKGGNQVGERHQSVQPDSNAPPSPFCPDHPNGTTRACRACGIAGATRRDWDAAQAAAAGAAAERLRSLIPSCPDCRGDGWVIGSDGTALDPGVKCWHPKLREMADANA
ncbi:hypothetical protein [Mycolicibacterium komossense]|uniref:Helix-turn-helix DNA binding domain protein n=1 Tax=Mycolicibacterium komossense TaxID=1779 RepID=A0ABT3CMB9_9MYCO|nr:hypothetical protein [Mycolicibacterium komossense]MCV7230699.1 hypothetical protein [Mycolicibacterium komossense]